MSQVSSDWVADAEIAPPLPAVRGASLLRRSLRLWRTRMTVAAQGVSQEQTLPTLIATAAPYFGKDMTEPETLSKRTVRDSPGSRRMRSNAFS